MRTLACAVAAAALTLGAPVAALAHQGNPNYRSVITRVTPPAAGVRLSVLNYDDRLLLQNAGRADVMVLDYQQKPNIHATADGTVAVNTNSEAYYLNEDRLGQAPVPKGLGPQPAWKVVSRNGRYDWHDHRIHWMGTGDPPQLKDKGVRTKLDDWTVPLRVNGQSVEANFGALRVLDAQGRQVQSGGTFHPGGRGAEVAVRQRPGLGDGSYTATYRVISADGHPVSSGFVFSVGNAAPGGKSVDQLLAGQSTGPITDTAFSIVRAIQYAASALGLGGLVFLLWSWLPALRLVAGGGAEWEAAWRSPERARSLFDTAFGRAVLIKIVVAPGIVALGYVNRQRVLPTLRAAGATPGRAGVLLRRTPRAELALGLVAIGASGALSGYAPSIAVSSGPYSTSSTLGPARMEVTVDPARVGPNQLHMHLFDRRTGAPFQKTKQLSVTAALPSKAIAPNEMDNASTVKLDLQLPPGFAAASFEPNPGWTVKVTKTRLATPIHTDDGDITEGVTRGRPAQRGHRIHAGVPRRAHGGGAEADAARARPRAARRHAHRLRGRGARPRGRRRARRGRRDLGRRPADRGGRAGDARRGTDR